MENICEMETTLSLHELKISQKFLKTKLFESSKRTENLPYWNTPNKNA